MKNKKTKALFTFAVSAMLMLASCQTSGTSSSGEGSIPASTSQSDSQPSSVPSTGPSSGSDPAPGTSSTGSGSDSAPSSQPSTDPNPSSSPSSPSSESSSSSVNPSATYTVTFNYNYTGGPRATLVRVSGGSTVEKPTDPTREGYSFSGWYTEIGCVNLFDFDTPITKNTVLFAGWEAANVTITYNFNYVGAPAMVTESATKGSVVTPIEDPTRENYSFAGWCTDQAGEHPFDFSAPISESVTLYAKWVLSVAVVTLDLGYEVEGKVTTQNVKVGEAMNKPSDPERTGYTFLGWFLSNASEAFDFTTLIETNITLTAKWEIIHLTVTFDFEDEREDVVVNVDYGNTVTEQANSKEGYTCMWTLNDAEFDFTTPITSSIVLKAKYEKQSSGKAVYTYHLNYTGAPNDGVFKTEEITLGERPTNPGEPERANAFFAGWYLDAACTTILNFVTARASADTDVYAKWLVKNRFEAEYTNLDNKLGHGFSVNTGGVNMIYDDHGTGASSGYYVSDLYYEGAFLQFDINSDRAVNDAVVIVAIQCEWDTKTFNPDLWVVEVNGVSLDYDEITIEGFMIDSQTDDRRPFITVEMNDVATLVKGANVIKLITNNNIYHGGTRQGDAPMIDYIDVYTDAILTWSPKTDNPSKRG